MTVIIMIWSTGWINIRSAWLSSVRWILSICLKKDISSYKLLLSYLGTYPNISVIFNKVTTNTYNLYEIIDIYNKIKNIKERDYIYISIVYNNTFLVNKVKKYSNLKDILECNQIIGKYYLINNNIKITNSNYLLDERVSQIVIK